MTHGPIVVVGGGISGLAAASAMSARGIAVAVLERRRTSVDAGLAINLPGNAVRAVEALGLIDGLEGLGRPIRRREYRTSAGKLLFEIDEERFWGGRYCSRAVRRGALLSLLELSLPSGTLRTDVEVEGVEDKGDRVDAMLVGGDIVTGRLLVGADGIGSRLRSRLQLGERRQSGLAGTSWRAMIANPGVDCWSLWQSPDCVILLMPVDEHDVYLWASLPTERFPTYDKLLVAADRFPSVVRSAIASTLREGTKLVASPLEEVHCRAWSKGRQLLIGDAAHAMAPVWAQGAALGLEDALVLADLIDHQADPIDVLAIFEARRRPRVAHVRTATSRMSRTASMPGWLRDLMLPSMGPRAYRSAYEPLRRLP